jgi:hypothetical protein
MSISSFLISHSALRIFAPLLAQTSATSDTYFIIPHVRAVFWMALTVLVLVLILWLLVSLRRRSRTLEVFTNTSGRVQVSRGALGDLVESSALQFGVVSRPRVNFKIRSGQVHLYIRLKLAAGQRLPEFSTGLQTHLTNTLRDSFGLDKLGGVHLTVTGFKGRALPVDVDDLKPLPRPASSSTPPSTPPRPPGGNFFGT